MSQRYEMNFSNHALGSTGNFKYIFYKNFIEKKCFLAENTHGVKNGVSTILKKESSLTNKTTFYQNGFSPSKLNH